MHGWMDKKNIWMVGWIKKWKKIDGWIDGLKKIYGWLEGWIKKNIYGWLEG